jgi:Xaa-Pro aminopeptidase
MNGRDTRLDKVRARLAETDADALLVTNLTNVRYLTGFSGTNAQVLVTGSGAYFFSDPRYAARAAELVQGAEVLIYPSKLTDLLPQRVAELGITRLGVEAKSMTLFERDQLGNALDGAQLVGTSDVVEDLRRAKDSEEIALMREAIRIADEGFDWVVDRLVPGASESEIALDLEVHMRRQGAEAVSFEPIVGSGPLSAHIHHAPSERTLEKGDTVLLDFGARWHGYCSDLTRTVVLGPASDEQRELYEVVLEAQRAGIAAVSAGAGGAEVDAAARRIIDDAGHGEDFGHGLGHGVGLDIHEAPRLHKTSDDALIEGDVVTVEPGIYVRGQAGVRIEDCVVVTSGAADVLTATPKDDLIEL